MGRFRLEILMYADCNSAIISLPKKTKESSFPSSSLGTHSFGKLRFACQPCPAHATASTKARNHIS
jgi:hypothetical protein